MSMTTIIIPVSRPDYLDRIFPRLELLQCDREETNILSYVDGDHRLYEKTRNLVAHSKFNQKLCIMRKTNSVSHGSVKRRRIRISKIHNEIKQYVENADNLFLIEDDTLFTTNTLEKLTRHLDSNRNIALASGIELGRWGVLHIGAWKSDDVYQPSRIETIQPKGEHQYVDATGLYCCLVRKDLYMQHEFKPLEDALGPDVNFGLWLRQQGYKILADTSIKCTHMTKQEDIKISNSEVKTVIMSKENDKWKMTINES